MMKKILLIMCSLVMIFSMTACGGGGQGGDNNGKEIVVPDMSLSKKIVIDWKIPTQDALSSVETPMIKYLANKFNVSFQVSEESPSAHDQKVDLLIAGKNIPTMLSRINTTRANEYGSYGAFVNFADYLDYMPNVKALIENAVEEDPGNAAAVYDDKGRIYRIPAYTANPFPIFNFSYNKEEFASVGYENPTTWNDVKNALIAIKNKRETGTSEKCYPFAMRQQESIGLQITNFIISFTGGYANGQEFIGYDPEADTFKFALDIDGYKEAIDFFRDLYLAGLIHPEYASMNGDQLLLLIGNEKSFMTCDFNGGFTGFAGREEQTSKLYPLHLPQAEGMDKTYGFKIHKFDMRAGTALSSAVLNDPVLLGRTLKIIDYMFSEEFINLQWYHPNITEGSYPEGETDPAKYQYTLDNEGNKQYKSFIYEKEHIGDVVNNYFNWSIYANFYNLNDPIVDPAKHGPYYAFRKELLTNDDMYVEVPVPIFSALEAKQISALNANIQSYFKTYISEFLHKSNPSMSWETFVNNLKTEGGDNLVKIYNMAYSRSKS